MEKIDTIFKRDPKQKRLVLDEWSCMAVAWVFAGEGRATWKWDGTACLARNQMLYRRHKLQEDKKMPMGWIHWSFRTEAKSGHGWLPCNVRNVADEYHCEAFMDSMPIPEGTYEMVGPKINKNPYKLAAHVLWPHGEEILNPPFSVTFEGIKEWLERTPAEGIVFWHIDGRMAKIKARDFGIQWPRPNVIKHG